MSGPRLLALIGPTATGKTEASLAIAEALPVEIVSIDSTLAFRGMDVWTGKPTPEQRRKVPHHLVDLVDPHQPLGLAEFQRQALRVIHDVRDRGRAPLLVGGSGLYYRAVVDAFDLPGHDPEIRELLEREAGAVGSPPLHARLGAFDPEAAGRIAPTNPRRTIRALEVAALTGRPFSSFYTAWERYPPGHVRAAGVRLHPEALAERIRERVRRNFDGLVEETQVLMSKGFGDFARTAHVIGYAEAAGYLEGRVSREQAMSRISRRDRTLARRQLGWFRKDPRVRWFDAGPEGAIGVVDQLIEYFRSEVPGRLAAGPADGAETWAAGSPTAGSPTAVEA